MQLSSVNFGPLLAAVLFSLAICHTADTAPIPGPEIAARERCVLGKNQAYCGVSKRNIIEEHANSGEPVPEGAAVAAPSPLSARDPQCQDMGFGCVTRCYGSLCRSVGRTRPAKRHIIEEHADDEEPVPEAAAAAPPRMITRSS